MVNVPQHEHIQSVWVVLYECVQQDFPLILWMPTSTKNMEMGLYHCQMHANLRTTIQTMEIPFMGAMQWGQTPQKGSQVPCNVGPTKRFIWIECNDFIFHEKCYQQKKLQSFVWEALLDYVKLEWNRTSTRIRTFVNWNMTILIHLIKLGENNSFSTIRIILMLGGHIAYPKWVSFFSV